MHVDQHTVLIVKPAWNLSSVGTVDLRILAVHPGHIGRRHRLFGV